MKPELLSVHQRLFCGPSLALRSAMMQGLTQSGGHAEAPTRRLASVNVFIRGS
jgi:hypothetical protein